MIEQPKMQQWKAYNDKYYNMRTFPPIEVEMNVPSGKIIIENDFRELWPEASDDFDVNETMGLKQTTEAYGQHGMFHGFVGNSCPSIYRKGDFFSIGNPGRDDDSDKITDPMPGERVAGVITDLWWYCIADLDDYLKRGGKIDKRWHGPDIVDVTPGRYVLKHYHGIGQRKDLNWQTKEVFATFERSDAPLNQWVMPEEPLYEELPKILTEIRHFHHDYKHDTDEFSLLMSVSSGKRKKKPGNIPDISENAPDIPWETIHAMAGKLRRVSFPAQLANEGRYDEIAVIIKKQMHAEAKEDLKRARRSRELDQLVKAQTPEQKARAAKLLEEVFADLERERDR